MIDKKKGFALLALILVLSFLIVCSGCGIRTNTENISIAGSTALLPLAQQAKQEFEKEHNEITVNISAGGSFTGLTQVGSGSVDIGTSDISVEEFPEYDSGDLVDHKVAVAPFVFITHRDVGVDSLNQEELVGILSGKIKNWHEVGGKNLKISIIHRALSSGSRAVIQKLVLKDKEFSPEAAVLSSNGEVRSAIASTPGAIGYVDAAYVSEEVQPLKYEGVSYTPENVYQGLYPVYAFGHMYTKGSPQGAVKEFLEFVQKEQFQNEVEKMGFLSVAKMKLHP